MGNDLTTIKQTTDKTIEIGDAVDCSGSFYDPSVSCTNGKVIGRNGDKEIVQGGWAEEGQWKYVRPDQITRHVPAAPVKPASVGSKLANEMTVREVMIKDFMAPMIVAPEGLNSLEKCAKLATECADILIAALDKERTK